eukprot:COSAG03_NODE_15535_length_428_cov_0.762918_1_plen_22_part_01
MQQTVRSRSPPTGLLSGECEYG